jgi:nucleoid-associated protein EbfC
MNPMDLLKNMGELQSRLKEAQESLKRITATGSAGGDMISIELNGQMEVRSVRISPDAVDPEDIGMLEDLVLAAFTDATSKVRDRIQQEMSSMTGGLNLPPEIFGS